MSQSSIPKPPFIAENLEITDIDQEGRGVSRYGDVVVFVEKAIPGDVVHARVFKKKSRFMEAALHEVVKPSPLRQQPFCRHFGTCGGCQWQHLQYSGQLQFKAQSVKAALSRIGNLSFPEPKPILSALADTAYRNKLDFSFSARSWLTKEELNQGMQDHPALGFHVRGVFDKVLPIESCHLMPPVVNDIRNAVRDFSVQNGYEYYHLKQHTGWLRNLVIRMSADTGKIMVILSVASEDSEKLGALFGMLQTRFPAISSCIWYLNQKLNDSFQGLEPRVWKDTAPYLTERLGQYHFQISPRSFFQTNTRQAERLYQVVHEAIGESVDVLYDLYCGAGSIGIFVSDKAKKIVGIEYVDEAVKDAADNCRLNGVNHLSFYAGDMKKLLNSELLRKEGRPQVIITDPPRAGMDAPVVAELLKSGAEKIIYVSCNPATQARDLALLDEGYRITMVQPVDMFPHTTHVECVVVLERKA
jgi:23S rRNA (uracil1939-C5)-methyltransferase